VVGVAYEAKLYALQVCDTAGYCYSDAMAKGIEDARYGPDGNKLTTSDNARVISMSISGPSSFGSAFETQMQNAYSEGLVLVAASGNEGTDVGYPARYAEFIAVGATDSSNIVPWWSNRGSTLELVAPGVSVYSTYKGDNYATMSGTSMATPHVSGVVALMFAKNPSLTPAQVRTILHNTATDLGAAGWDVVTGYGLLNAFAAVIAS
ncbi:MAG: S8 family serine peptidase, partial [Candidatus Micrarchaeota archaeon]